MSSNWTSCNRTFCKWTLCNWTFSNWTFLGVFHSTLDYLGFFITRRNWSCMPNCSSLGRDMVKFLKKYCVAISSAWPVVRLRFCPWVRPELFSHPLLSISGNSQWIRDSFLLTNSVLPSTACIVISDAQRRMRVQKRGRLKGRRRFKGPQVFHEG